VEALEIARKLAGYGDTAGACEGYEAALAQGLEPKDELEAAVYILQFGGDYKIAYGSFLKLYGQDRFRETVLPILEGAFYEPNEKDLKKRYENNCKLLRKYPYCFRRDFPNFEDLSVRFFPYDDWTFVPFYPEEARFGEPVDFKEPVVRHCFFRDLEKPVLAKDIFSQYELEYLNDNVRKSEYVGRENHIYLHYTDWAAFCAHLQCWDLRPLLADEKLVFLFGDEIDQYPIDFKVRFGVDYSRSVRPVGIREVQRLILHTQLSAHNGGDFFDEVFDGHPNLLVSFSVLMDGVEEQAAEVERWVSETRSERDIERVHCKWELSPPLARELFRMKKRSPKDILVALFLSDKSAVEQLDPHSRIAPALFFQPHFERMASMAELDDRGRAVLMSNMYDRLRQSPLLRGFKYVKAFTPMRRPTNSYAATIHFMEYFMRRSWKTDTPYVMDDALFVRIMSRGFMVDPEDRLFKDSVLVRFEDGKLNPKATFTALAAFLDLPYTESMTWCSARGVRDPHPETKGFDPVSVYRTYDEFANDAERTLIEYFLRDAYGYYGYDFQYYDGGPMDEARVKELIAGCAAINGYIRESLAYIVRRKLDEKLPDAPEERRASLTARNVDRIMAETDEKRMGIAKILLAGLEFVNPEGQPLRMMPKLEPDPALLEQPLYH